MRNAMRMFVLSLVATALVVAPSLSSSAPAKEFKPVAVVGASGVNAVFSDIDYMAGLAGAPQVGVLAKLMGGPLVAGVDGKRPWGVAVTVDGDAAQPKALGFVPVTDLDAQLAAIKDFINGEPKDAGDGVMQLANPPLFLKEVDGWAFIAQSKEDLSDLPKDPAKLLGDLVTTYDLGIRVNADNIPAELKDKAIEGLKQGVNEAFENAPNDDKEAAELARTVADTQIKQIVGFINDMDQLTVGLKIDADNKRTFLDFSLKAKAGTKTAKQFAYLKDTTTNFSGFNIEGAAASSSFSYTETNKAQIKQLVAMLDTFKVAAAKEIDNDSDLPTQAKRDAAKSVIEDIIDVLTATVKSGKMDGGFVAMLEPKSMTAVAGAKVAETAKLDKALRELVKIAEDDPKFPGIKFNADSLGDVKFHTMTAPIPNDEERKVFGKSLPVVIGIGSNSAYIAFGNNALKLTKSIITKSKKAGPTAVPAAQFKLALGPILKFALSIEETPAAVLMAAALGDENGQVTITADAIDNGARYRIELEESVIKAVGAVAAGGGGGGGPGGPGARPPGF